MKSYSKIEHWDVGIECRTQRSTRPETSHRWNGNALNLHSCMCLSIHYCICYNSIQIDWVYLTLNVLYQPLCISIHTVGTSSTECAFSSFAKLLALFEPFTPVERSCRLASDYCISDMQRIDSKRCDIERYSKTVCIVQHLDTVSIPGHEKRIEKIISGDPKSFQSKRVPTIWNPSSKRVREASWQFYLSVSWFSTLSAPIFSTKHAIFLFTCFVPPYINVNDCVSQYITVYRSII